MKFKQFVILVSWSSLVIVTLYGSEKDNLLEEPQAYRFETEAERESRHLKYRACASVCCIVSVAGAYFAWYCIHKKENC